MPVVIRSSSRSRSILVAVVVFLVGLLVIFGIKAIKSNQEVASISKAESSASTK